MLPDELKTILQEVAAGRVSPERAFETILGPHERPMGFARLDLDRPRRTGMPEVIYGPGKTPEQLIELFRAMREAGQRVLATRVTPEQASAVRAIMADVQHHPLARALTWAPAGDQPKIGAVGVVSAGTADLPVAEEAALTAEWMGANVTRLFDVGVAGLHRLMRHLSVLRAQRVLVVVAGMEGALPSVVGGLVDRPIVAVPTSVGYGLHFGGLAPLLAMLNSCAPGVTVVNVDNGFGAGVAAARINRLGEPS